MNLTNKIDKTLTLIEEQIGLRLELCDHFTGIRYFNDKPYFNVVFKDRLNCSLDYVQLIRWSNKYKTINVERNGLKRASIVLND